MAEGDRLRLAAVLAADAELDVVAGPASALDGDLHQVAHPALVDRLERVALQDPGLEVVREVLYDAVEAVMVRDRASVRIRVRDLEFRLAAAIQKRVESFGLVLLDRRVGVVSEMLDDRKYLCPLPVAARLTESAKGARFEIELPGV